MTERRKINQVDLKQLNDRIERDKARGQVYTVMSHIQLRNIINELDWLRTRYRNRSLKARDAIGASKKRRAGTRSDDA